MTISETKVLFEGGITVGGKLLREILESYGHSHAFDYMLFMIDKKTIQETDIKELHRLFTLAYLKAKQGI